MTIAFRAAATPAYNGTGTTSFTIPATVEGGDLLLLVATHKVATGTGSLAAPAGWTAIAGGAVNMAGTTGQTLVAYRVAAGTPGSVSTDAGTSVTVTQVSAQQLAVVMAAWSGVDTTSPVRDSGLAANSSTASTSVSCPAETTSAGDQVVLVAGARGSVNGAYSWSPPAGYTLESSTGGVGGSQNMWSAVADGTSSGAQTLTTSIATWSIGGQVVLAEAATGHTTTGTGTGIGTASAAVSTTRPTTGAGPGRGAGSSTSTTTRPTTGTGAGRGAATGTTSATRTTAGTGLGRGAGTSTTTTTRSTTGTGAGRGAASGTTTTTRTTARTGAGRGGAAAAIATARFTVGTGAARGTASAVTSQPGTAILAGALALGAAAAGLAPSSSTAGALAPAASSGRFG